MLHHLYLNDSEITADNQTRLGRFTQYGFTGLLATDKKTHTCSLSKASTSKALHKPQPGQSVPYTRQTVGQLQPGSGVSKSPSRLHQLLGRPILRYYSGNHNTLLSGMLSVRTSWWQLASIFPESIPQSSKP